MNIILLGPPGCGKGTQASRLSEKFNLYKLSTGDLVRTEIASGSEQGKKIKQIVDSGNLPGDDLILNLIEATVKSLISRGKGIIFDGVPRTLNQAEKIAALLKSLNSSISNAIELKVNDEALTDRIVNRYTCLSCGSSYNEKFQQPKVEGICDKCGSSRFDRRSDDKEEVVKQRLAVYREQTAPLVDYYAKQGLLTQVDGLQEIEEVSQALEEVLLANAGSEAI